jgi:hypothetical protein
MVGQAPSQNATQATSNVAATPRVLLEDSIFKSIHDAFQMGWNIIELKSRLQLASVSSNIAGFPTTVPTSRPVDSSPPQDLIQSVLPQVADAQSKLLQPEAGIIQQPATATTSRINLTQLPESIWSTSLWRAAFNCIADSHKNCFPDSSTEDTYYDLPNPPEPASPPNYQLLVTDAQGSNVTNIHLPYYYLYPSNDNQMDYANVGIPQDEKFPDKFKLYDVTRRALNCLTLLYTNPEDSLIPVTVSYYQQQLLQNISTYKGLATTMLSNASSIVPSQATTGALNQTNAPQGTGTQATQSDAGSGAAKVGDSTALSLEQQRTDAIQLVSNHTMRYLENWDSFARETLYVSGSGLAQSSEMQLVAYEAGRAMSSLSWGITTTTVQLEDANSPAEELETLLQRAWLSIFDEPTISRIQHQISALSNAMDGAYYRVHTDVPRPNGNTTQAAQNLDLPSQGIQAITSSLDYWKRAVKKICDDNQQQNTIPAVTSTVSQVAQSTSQSTTQKRDTFSTTNTSTTSVTTQSPSVPKMNAQTSSQLRQALIKQTQVWQPLVLHQQSLQDFTMSYVTQRIWNDFMQEFEQATSKGVFNTVEKNFRRYLIPIIAGITVLILILGFLVFLLVRFPDLQQSLITTFVLVIGSVVGFFGTTAGRMRSFFSTESASASAAVENAGPIIAIAGIAGTGLIDAFQNGYQQIQTEFNYLDHNVSVTYPLVEFFISNAIQSITSKIAQSQSNNTSSKETIKSEATTDTGDVIKDAYDFLTQIVWTDQDKAEEIARIARAALGPIGALIAVPNQS